MSMRRILLAVPVSDAFGAAIALRAPVVGPLAPPLQAAVDALDTRTRAEVAGAVTIGGLAFPASVMDALPALQWIGCTGSGFEGVDLAAAVARGIAVTHSPGGNASSVADLALGLMIASVRGMPQARRRLDAGTWRGNAAEAVPLVRGLTGRRLGVYGLGEIGTRIARRAEAFEMEVAYHNRRRRVDVAWRYFPSLHALAEWADVLAIAVRADAANRHAVDASVLRALGPEGHVVNIARGFVIDEAALVTALREGTIAGAGLDVFEHEPKVPAELLALPNVALTAHVGGGTVQARETMERMLLANLDAFLDARPLPNPVPGSSAEPVPRER